MAIWRAENSMLTKVGVEILNKIKSGVGNITVTRVTAGSGRVSESQLFTQTSLSGTTKPMVISQKDVRETGSEISIYISNADYTESFNLNQIGVFVTHPDYEGEVLYHISQCDSVGFDVIPALDETPVTFGYNLFLEHGNSSSINLTIDPQGIISIEKFNNFVNGITPNHLVIADTDKNLQDAGKSVSELYNPNLLTNAYFPFPVNHRNGYVVPPNTPYYQESGLTTQVGVTNTYVRATKINDTYGVIILNNVEYYVSWGKSVKGYASPGVSIDRWSLMVESYSYVLIEEDGILLGNLSTEQNYNIRQSVTLKPSQLAGQRFTVSMLSTDGRFATATSEVYKGGEHWDLAHINIDGIYVYVDCNGVEFFGIQTILSPGASLKIKALKLEFGTQQTLAHQDADGNWVLNEAPDYAKEATKCSQYSYITDEYRGETPYSLVYDSYYLTDISKFNETMIKWFNSMENKSVKNFHLNCAVNGAPLQGGMWTVTISRVSDSFGSILATKYIGDPTSGGIQIKTCSIYSGNLTSWGAINSDSIIPATVE